MKLAQYILILITQISLPIAAHADAVNGVPSILSSSTSTYLFDESINHQSGFSISQNDSRLKDLFAPNGNSALCGPTTLANIMAYLKLWRHQPLTDLSLAQDPLQGDYSQVVRDFAKRCQTDPVHGTLVVNLVSCLRQYFQDSGYSQAQVSWIGATSAGVNQKMVGIDDIRSTAKADAGIVLEVLWYSFDLNQNAWVTDGSGHYVAVVGYDYDASWGDREIHLKIINPEIDYRGRDSQNRWDSIQMIQAPFKAGVKFPAFTQYILDGYNFKGVTKRAFVRNLITFNVDTP